MYNKSLKVHWRKRCLGARLSLWNTLSFKFNFTVQTLSVLKFSVIFEDEMKNRYWIRKVTPKKVSRIIWMAPKRPRFYSKQIGFFFRGKLSRVRQPTTSRLHWDQGKIMFRFVNIFHRHGPSAALRLIFEALGPFSVMRKSNYFSAFGQKLSIKASKGQFFFLLCRNCNFIITYFELWGPRWKIVFEFGPR